MAGNNLVRFAVISGTGAVTIADVVLWYKIAV
jgi:hypothetical protein